MTKKLELKKVTYVNWEEPERGWETRPDGCSLHLTLKDYKAFEEAYWAKMPKEVPDEYSRPAGEPVEVRVNSKLYREIKKTKNGLRLHHEGEELESKEGNLVYGSKRSGWVPLQINEPLVRLTHKNLT
jgi:hypothetical protein